MKRPSTPDPGAGRSNRQAPSPRRGWRKARPGRLRAGLVGLSSAAIVSVYATGYISTRSAAGDNLLAADPLLEGDPSASATATPATGQASSAAAARATATATRAPATSAQAVATYADGSYAGVGSSRHGSIQATVVIQGGKIASANITVCGTRYSCSKVSTLVTETVTRQAAPTRHVSGATDSSRAYIQAIQSALALASGGSG